MSLINQRNVKILVFTFSLFNVAYLVYGLINKGLWHNFVFDFFLFQFVLFVFYVLFVSSVKWFNERMDDQRGLLNKTFDTLSSRIDSSNSEFSINSKALIESHKSLVASLGDLTNQMTQLQNGQKNHDSIIRSVELKVSEIDHMKSENKDLNASIRRVMEDLEGLRHKLDSLLVNQQLVSGSLDKNWEELKSHRGLKDMLNLIQQKHSDFSNSINGKLVKIESSAKESSHLLGGIRDEVSDSIKKSSIDLSKNLELQYGRIDALFSIYSIVKPNAPIPMMKDWAISSDYAHFLMDRFLSKDQKTILDVGSGISTILLAYLVKMRGTGFVVSLEHDELYAKQTMLQLKKHQLDKYAKVFYCPIVKYRIGGSDWSWYDISQIDIKDISLISVDGPPGALQPLSRYPVIPLVWEWCDSDVEILLDDADRKDEQQIAQRWTNEYDLDHSKISSHKGISYFRRIMS